MRSSDCSSDVCFTDLLNSPLLLCFNWLNLPHMKDVALTPVGFKMEQLPIAPPKCDVAGSVPDEIDCLRTLRGAQTVIHDWLRHEFGLEKPGRALAEPQRLDAKIGRASCRERVCQSV